MGVFRLDRLLDFLHSGALFVALLWLGLIALTVGLVVLMYTRWGRVHPLRKSLALSLLAHALLAGYSTTVYVMPAVLEEFLPVSLALDRSGAPGGLSGESKDADAPSAEPSTTAARAAHTARTLKARPWEAFGHVSGVRPPMAELARIEPPDLSRPQRQSLGEAGVLAGLPDLDHLPLAEPLLTQPEPLPASHLAPVKKPPKAATGRNAEAIQAPAAERRTGARSSLPGPAQVARPTEPPGPASEPVRSSQAGLPTKLLQRTLPLPRPDEGSVPVTPEGTLAVVTRPPSDSAPRRPADTGDSRLPGTSGQLAGTSGTAPAEAGMMAGSGDVPTVGGPSTGATGHLLPPSLASASHVAVQPGAVGIGAGIGAAGVGPPQLPTRALGRPDQRLPDLYRLRTSPDRARLAEMHGATPQTEAAVQAALRWFTNSQASDGRWDPRKHEAGREGRIADHDRFGAGSTADTGLTGLATLTFLAAGNTHLEGPHQATTRRALEYLLRAQAPDGNLAGNAAVYEFMYCHAMATIALSEAYGMSKDPRLREPVQRAIAYTLATQDPSGGGWRYRSQEAGDTSQLGWQVMALKSAELAGIRIPSSAWTGVGRFLKSVSSGSYGGYAAYRPNEQVSRSMTAEALMCRQFLGLPPDNPTSREAGDYLLGELPGEKRADFYYWYYGTMAMYQLQGVHWQRWNDAMRTTLVTTQQKSGPAAGSWDPDSLWGTYGGRVYSTALATLCLEIYYRFLPLYGEAASAGQPAR